MTPPPVVGASSPCGPFGPSPWGLEWGGSLVPGVDVAALQRVRDLGAGSGGVVWLGETRGGDRFAVKTFSMTRPLNRLKLMAEIRALYGGAPCATIVGFHGASAVDEDVCIVLDYYNVGSIGSLLARLRGTPPVSRGMKAAPPPPREDGAAVATLPLPALAGVAFQCLWALAFLRVEGRLHRDVTPGNVLMDSCGAVCLTDFGLSREVAAEVLASTFCGSIKYLAPERVRHEAYGFPADIWGLGITLFDAAQGYPWEHEESSIGLLYAIAEGPLPTLSDTPAHPPSLRAFLARMLQHSPQSRATAVELLDDPWLGEQGVYDLPSAREAVKQWLAVTPGAFSPRTVVELRGRGTHDGSSGC